MSQRFEVDFKGKAPSEEFPPKPCDVATCDKTREASFRESIDVTAFVLDTHNSSIIVLQRATTPKSLNRIYFANAGIFLAFYSFLVWVYFYCVFLATDDGSRPRYSRLR